MLRGPQWRAKQVLAVGVTLALSSCEPKGGAASDASERASDAAERKRPSTSPSPGSSTQTDPSEATAQPPPQPQRAARKAAQPPRTEPPAAKSSLDPELLASCRGEPCHRAAMRFDANQKLEDAVELYARACASGWGPSCLSLGTWAQRCLYTSGYAFYAAAHDWLTAGCNAQEPRACMEAQLLEYPPSEASAPPWLPNADQCTRVRGALSGRTAPGAQAPPTWQKTAP